MKKLAALVALVFLFGGGDALAADVGHTVRHVVVPGSALSEPRQVDVHLGDPSADVAGHPLSVFSSARYRHPLPAPYTPLGWTVAAELAHEDAPIAPSGRPFPVIVFSHGSTNDPIDYAHTLELIASHGFVVAAPAHVNNTQDDVRIDFANARANAGIPCNDGRPGPCSRPQVAFSMADRVRDLSSVIDALPGWFGPRVDMARVGALGHSRGSASILAAAGGSGPRVAGDANCQATGTTCWPVTPEPRIQAVMGLAIAAMPLAQHIDFGNITVPVQLVAGFLDRTSPQAVSEFAFDHIASPDKAFLSLPQGVHRTFDSTYCDQAQSAGALAQSDPNAILDRHTFELTVLAPPTGSSGRAVEYCSFATFTEPVDIRPLVESASGYVVTSSNTPSTGLETDAVKVQMAQLAVDFFGAKLARAAGGEVGGTVPATLSLTLGDPASFGAFTPGVDGEYLASTTAGVTSTAGDATLSVTDATGVAPGHLVNGGFTLPQALSAGVGGSFGAVSDAFLSLKTWGAPVSHDAVTIDFKQSIGQTDALRTGTYAKTLTFTLSTTMP
jgi:predicted dienelactone hydrolase